MYAEAFNSWKEKFRAEALPSPALSPALSPEIIGKWQKAILDALECHFAPLPPSAAEDIKKVSDPEELQNLLVSLWKVKTLQEALDEIKRHAV